MVYMAIYSTQRSPKQEACRERELITKEVFDQMLFLRALRIRHLKDDIAYKIKLLCPVYE